MDFRDTKWVCVFRKEKIKFTRHWYEAIAWAGMIYYCIGKVERKVPADNFSPL